MNLKACREYSQQTHESSKFSPEATGETLSFLSLTVKLDKFLQNSLGGREVAGIGKKGGAYWSKCGSVCLSRLARKEQGTLVFPEQR